MSLRSLRTLSFLRRITANSLGAVEAISFDGMQIQHLCILNNSIDLISDLVQSHNLTLHEPHREFSEKGTKIIHSKYKSVLLSAKIERYNHIPTALKMCVNADMVKCQKAEARAHEVSLNSVELVPDPPWGQRCGRSSLRVLHTCPRSVLQGEARARVPPQQREGSAQHEIVSKNIWCQEANCVQKPNKSIVLFY